MSRDTTRKATALIDHIQSRFHEGHRRALPALLARAAAVEARGIDSGLVGELRRIGNALEQHMFKEERHRIPPSSSVKTGCAGGRTAMRLPCWHLHVLPSTNRLPEHAGDGAATRASTRVNNG